VFRKIKTASGGADDRTTEGEIEVRSKSGSFRNATRDRRQARNSRPHPLLAAATEQWTSTCELESFTELSEGLATSIGEFTQAHLAPRILDEECDGTSPQEARPTVVRVPHARRQTQRRGPSTEG
jgi:hypothetical protein